MNADDGRDADSVMSREELEAWRKAALDLEKPEADPLGNGPAEPEPEKPEAPKVEPSPAEPAAPRFSDEALALIFAERHAAGFRYFALWGKLAELGRLALAHRDNALRLRPRPPHQPRGGGHDIRQNRERHRQRQDRRGG